MVAPSDPELLGRADLVVVATVTGSTTREAAGGNVMTDYRLRVEDVQKGSAAETITVSELGGVFGNSITFVPGSARYRTGSRVLAFLRQRDDGTYYTAHMSLGAFRFAVSGDGATILVRDTEGLEIETPEVLAPGNSEAVQGGLTPVASALPSAYVFSAEPPGFPSRPLRWNCDSCPVTVSFKINGTVPGATTAVENALAHWSDDPNSALALGLAGTTANTTAGTDGENVILLESNVSAPGICDGALACAIGHATTSVHTYRGEQFYTVIEGDVIVRPGKFTETVAGHEVGHVLAFRHSNQGTPSSTDALMNSVIDVDSGGALRSWDKEAVAEVYGNGLPCVAPAVTSTSGGGSVPNGSTASLSVTATGSTPRTYQWYNATSPTEANPVGTSSPSFTTPPITTPQSYWVKVTNACGSANSGTINVTPQDCSPAQITSDPQSKTIGPGTSTTLSVGATGSSPLTYQWYRGNATDTSNPVGTNSPNFTTGTLNTTTSFWVHVSNACGNDDSATAVVTVAVAECLPPTIMNQTHNVNVPIGNSTTLSVFAQGSGPFTYEWYRGDASNTSDKINGATDSTFNTGVLNTQGAFKFWVRVKSNCSVAFADSQTMTVTVSDECVKPTISNQTLNVNITVGSAVELFVSAAGTSPVTYEWYRGQAPDTSSKIDGATGQTLNTGVLSTPGTLKFWARVKNNCPGGSVDSQTMTVTVSCLAQTTPKIFAPPASPATVSYFVTWEANLASSPKFELQEANNAGFANPTTFTIDGALAKEIVAHTSISGNTRFYYRVRGISPCLNNAATEWSEVTNTLNTTPQPQDSIAFSISIPEGTNQTISQNYLVPGFGDSAHSGDTFSITIDAPWLSVFPTNGALSAGGTTVQFTINPALAEDVGSQSATVSVVRTPGTGGASVGAHDGPVLTPIPFGISLVTPVTPQPRDTNPPPGTLIIPAVAHADGIGTRFQSDIRIANASGEAITYDLNFTPSATSGTNTGKKTTLVLKPNETLGLDDVVKAWFGSGIFPGETGLGTLEIRPIRTASNNVPNALATFASSRTYAISARGTLGQFIPAIPLSSFISDVSKDALMKISLQQIANSNAYRTNVGFVEGAGQAVQLLVKLLDGNGTLLQSVPLSLGPYEHRQTGWAGLFGNTQVTDGRIEMEVTSPGGKATAYASVLDNDTNDPLMVFPVQAYRGAETKYVVPGVAELNAGSNFHTDMRIFNPGTTPVNVALTYQPQRGDPTPIPAAVNMTIDPGDIKAIDNVLPTLWGLNATGGSVSVQTASAAPLVVTARTFSREADGGTYGQFIPAVSIKETVGLGDRALEILQLEQSGTPADRAGYRSNVGFVEVTGNPATVEITLRPPDSKLTAIAHVDLAPNEFLQLGSIFKWAGFQGNVYNGRVSIRVVNGTGRVAGYGSVIDNRTEDPTYVYSQ